MNADQINVVVFFGVIGLVIAGVTIHNYVIDLRARIAGFFVVYMLFFLLAFWAAGVGSLV